MHDNRMDPDLHPGSPQEPGIWAYITLVGVLLAIIAFI